MKKIIGVEHVDMIIAKKLKMRRMILGLTRQEVGIAIGVSGQQIQKYEMGVNRIAGGRLSALSKVLDVPVLYFFLEDEELMKTVKNCPEKEILKLVKSYTAIKIPSMKKKVLDFINGIAYEYCLEENTNSKLVL